jgi:hypothetical protein
MRLRIASIVSNAAIVDAEASRNQIAPRVGHSSVTDYERKAHKPRRSIFDDSVLLRVFVSGQALSAALPDWRN